MPLPLRPNLLGGVTSPSASHGGMTNPLPSPSTLHHPTLSLPRHRDASPDVPRLCGVAINAYLTMLLDTGTLHCDPHPGNLLRTTDGRLCILDWGMTLQVRRRRDLCSIRTPSSSMAPASARWCTPSHPPSFVPLYCRFRRTCSTRCSSSSRTSTRRTTTQFRRTSSTSV